MGCDVIIDRTKDWLVVWVPGTGGHEVHPGFQAAVDRVLGDKAQVFLVSYPASIDFEQSVPAGEDALKLVLRTLAAEKLDFQRVVVAGSSQGSWVIDAVHGDPAFEVVFKTVMFGLPAEAPPLTLDADTQVINSPVDAVTMPWLGNEQQIIRHVSAVVEGRWWHLVPMFGYMALNPVQVYLLAGLLMTHYRCPRLSPHDYTPQMPLAVKWLTT